MESNLRAQQGARPVRKATGDEVHTACWFCNEDAESRGRLYINCDQNAAIPGLFRCFLCDTQGSLVKIKKHFGDYDPKENREEDLGETGAAIMAAATRYHQDCLKRFPEVYTWLQEARGFTDETIAKAQLGYDDGHLHEHLRAEGFSHTDIYRTGLVGDGREGVTDFLRGCVTIPYHVVNNVITIRGRVFDYDGKGAKYKTLTGAKARLYNSDATWHAEDLYVAEGESRFLK